MRIFMALLGVTAMLSIAPATPALAEGAIVINEDGCFGQVPNADGVLSGPIVIGDLHQRTTKSGITTLTCHFDLDEATTPPKARKASGFACGFVGGVITTDTRANASPGGRMVMTCRIKA